MEPSLTELRLRNTEAKLARLIAAVNASPAWSWRDCKCRECTELRAAIEEARRKP